MTREEAEAALAQVLRDEPDWGGGGREGTDSHEGNTQKWPGEAWYHLAA